MSKRSSRLQRPFALRQLLPAAAALLLITSAGPEPISAQAPDAAAPERTVPNIVLIVADDLGYGDLGCYGQQRIQTPNIDRLAREGMRFTDFYAGSTVCAPSRCVLMTGYHTGHCLIRGNAKDNLRPSDVTIAEVLREAGYATCLAGKWGLGHEGSDGVPTRQGFDHFFGYLDQTHAHNYYPTFLIRNETRVKLDNVVPNEGRWGQGAASVKKQYSHDLIVKEAFDWLENHHDQPFFLYLALTLPHANNEAGAKGMEIPDYGMYANESWPEPQKGHAAMITRMDADIGRLMQQLERHGVADNTLVFFTSDNGPHAEGGNDPDFQDSNGQLRGIKRSLTEGGIRVPLIAHWPAKIRPGATSQLPAAFWDFMPTCAEVAGAKQHVPADADGLSFLPTLLGNASEQQSHDFLYWAFYERGGAQAIRQGSWKAVQQPYEAPVRLYDLSNDLGESHDLAKEHPKQVARLKELMDAAYSPSPRWKFPEAKQGR